jgi:hypothetical protein
MIIPFRPKNALRLAVVAAIGEFGWGDSLGVPISSRPFVQSGMLRLLVLLL